MANYISQACVIIPAYNEATTISKVIKDVKDANPKLNIVVINDGSRDNTSKIASEEKVDVVDLPFNLGIGGSVQTGLKYAKQENFDLAIQVDADGQHDPRNINKLLESLDAKTDMVIGSRFMTKTKYSSSLIRRIGIEIFSFLIRLTCKKKIYDSTSGFRVFGKKAIDFLSIHYPIDFPEPESIVTLLKNGYKIKEVPVEMKKRQGGTSSVTKFKAIFFMSSISLAILIQSLKKRKAVYERGN